MKRREFLGYGGMGLAAAHYGLHAPFARAAAAPKTLIVLFLRGGCDGLNMVVPYGDRYYYQERGGNACPPPGEGQHGVVDLDGFFGLNQTMASLEPIWKGGRLAVFPAVHYEQPIFSHFAGQDRIEYGGLDGDSGWLYRYLQDYHSDNTRSFGAYEALAVSGKVPRSMSGKVMLPNISPRSQFGLPLRNIEARASLLSEIDKLARMQQSGLRGEIIENLRLAAQARRDLEQLDEQGAVAASFPDTELGKKLLLVYRLYRMRLGTRVFALSRGGWDTHLIQGGPTGNHSARVGDLADSLAAFDNAMGSAMENTVLLVMTEFGRSVKFAGTGTDHGNAGAWMAMGGPVRGGIYGDWPGLSPMEQYKRRYLAHSIDFQDLLGDALHFLSNSPDMDRIFPLRKYQPIGYINT